MAGRGKFSRARRCHRHPIATPATAPQRLGYNTRLRCRENRPMLWLKAFHIIAVVCWFAGIFYLPRLFVYHTLAADQATREHLKIMERKLYRFMTPFAWITVALGAAMILVNPSYYLHAGWLHLKLMLVAVLVGYHLYCGRLLRAFAADRNRRGHVFYRWLNELPVLVLFAAVILAVVKPF
jgi:putative membrane protein